jgi:hypothetical protein
MTKLLTEAFEKASKLSPEEQDQVARWLLEELEDELKWSAAFEDSQDALSKMADHALEERRAGQTKPLDPDDL